jgi:hypothetical protein
VNLRPAETRAGPSKRTAGCTIWIQRSWYAAGRRAERPAEPLGEGGVAQFLSCRNCPFSTGV